MRGVKPTIAVLKGGLSEEFTLSMQNGAVVAGILRNNSQFNVVEISITKNGDWLDQGIVRSPQDILQTTDIAYIGLHGLYGEDGTVQRILERSGVPYLGSKPFASAVALNKQLTKESLQKETVLMAPHMRVRRADTANYDNLANTIGNLFGPAYVIKPLRGGSSIGVKHAESTLQLAQALRSMLAMYDDVLVEQYIPGIDVTCGVIDGFRLQNNYVTPVVEIVQTSDRSDMFQAEKISPGRFSQQVKDAIAELALHVHQKLQIKDLSRSDFRVTEKGEIYFLEVNTLPAVTPDAPLIAGLESVGASQEELVCHLCGQLMT